MPTPKPPVNPTADENVELEYKRLQILLMREEIDQKMARRESMDRDRAKMLADMKKAEAEKRARQRVCKHRKGGRNNKFANGTDANYSIIQNTYPTGEIMIMCTRCGKEVWKPSPELKKTDPEVYAAMLAEWREWSNYPTDNSPSGSKIFEKVA